MRERERTYIYKPPFPKQRMNINAIRAEQRSGKISEIINSINKVFANGQEVDFENLINQSCFNHKVSKRTSKEYIDVALSQINHDIEKRDGRRIIKSAGPTETNPK